MREPDFTARIPTTDAEDVRVTLEELRGRPVIDVRAFADFKAGPATVRGPTKAGVTLDLARLPELIRALDAARAEAAARGLLTP